MVVFKIFLFFLSGDPVIVVECNRAVGIDWLVSDHIDDERPVFLFGGMSNFRLLAFGILLIVFAAVGSLFTYLLYLKWQDDKRKHFY